MVVCGRELVYFDIYIYKMIKVNHHLPVSVLVATLDESWKMKADPLNQSLEIQLTTRHLPMPSSVYRCSC